MRATPTTAGSKVQTVSAGEIKVESRGLTDKADGVGAGHDGAGRDEGVGEGRGEKGDKSLVINRAPAGISGERQRSHPTGGNSRLHACTRVREGWRREPGVARG